MTLIERITAVMILLCAAATALLILLCIVALATT